MILNHVRLLPELSDGIAAEDGSVVIEDGKIINVCRESSSSEMSAFDCGGKTLLPGLIDLHTHMTVVNMIGEDKVNSPMGLLAIAAEHATHYLDHGFTTIRDCGSIHRVANYVSYMQQTGTITAPNIISCGHAIMPTEVEEGNQLIHHLTFADGENEIRKSVRRECAEKADFIKIFASGAAADPNGVPQQAIMTEEEIQASVNAASIKGRYVAAHCHSDAAIKLCALNGVKTIEHATLMEEKTLEIVENTNNCYIIPTLAVMYIGEGPKKAYWEKRLGPMFNHCVKIIERAYNDGMKLGFGTDCAPGGIEYANGIEFRFRSENCHMKAVDILIQATANNADIAGIDGKVGRIKSGLSADLILVTGKPETDISVMYKEPAVVLKDGVIVRNHI